jgi:peptide-methionine (S)-S-oxide reductase
MSRIGVALLASLLAGAVPAQEDVVKAEKATFAAGCFWGVEAAFRQIPGVLDTQVGYTGGPTVNPTYRQVCSGTTGHAEAVELVFDPTRVSYRQLLEAFFRMHDPTQVNRQGPDIGSQYRSAIFFHTPEQRELADAVKISLGAQLRQPIATQIVPAGPFYRAEEYHQRYFEKNGGPACHFF